MGNRVLTAGMVSEPGQVRPGDELQAWRFFAAGRPRTKGSTRTFQHKTTGRMVTLGANPKTKAWQGVIAHAAHEAGAQRLEGGVCVWVTFSFARPKSHMGTGRNAGKVKATAPTQPTGRNLGDLDKLLRAVLDGLTGVAFADDSQVVAITCGKRWAKAGQPEGAQITYRAAVPWELE